MRKAFYKLYIFSPIIIITFLFGNLIYAYSTVDPDFYAGNVYNIEPNRLSETEADVEWTARGDMNEDCYIKYSQGAIADSLDLTGYKKVDGKKVCDSIKDCEYDGQYYYKIHFNNLESNALYYYRIICTQGDSGYYQTLIKKLYPYVDYGDIKNQTKATEIDPAFLKELHGSFVYANEIPSEIWYVDFDGSKYNLSEKNILSFIEKVAIGIKNKDLNNIPTYNSGETTTGTEYNGKFLLQTEDRGRIWYVNKQGQKIELIFATILDTIKPMARVIDISSLNQIGTGNIPISPNIIFDTIKYGEPKYEWGSNVIEKVTNTVTGERFLIGKGDVYGTDRESTYVYYGTGTYSEKVYDGPYKFIHNLQARNTGANISYLADTAAKDEKRCEASEYGFQFVRNKIKNPHYSCGWDYQFFSYSPDGENYIIRNNKGDNADPEQFIVLSDLGNGEYYDYIDSLQWFDNTTFIYRAQINDKWRVAINNEDQDIFNYIDNIKIVDGKIKFRARYDDGSWSEQEISKVNGDWAREELERIYNDRGEEQEFMQLNKTSDTEAKEETVGFFKRLLRKLGLLKS